MKKTSIITALLMLLSISVYAQNKEPENMVFEGPGSATFKFDINDPKYQQQGFMLGWQWGGHIRMTEALKMNAKTYNCSFPTGLLPTMNYYSY